MDFLILFLLTFVVFFVIDIVWLGVIAKKLYNELLGFLLKENVNWVAAMVFYVLFIVGLVYFALMPAVAEASFSLALLNGALFGFFCYATYDLTNLATVKDWPVKITVIDLVWGTFVGGASASIAYFLFSLF